MYRVLLVLSLCLFTVYAKNEDLEGQTLYKVKVQTAEQVQFVSNLAERLLLDIWTYPIPDRDGYVLVPRDLRHAFQKELFEAKITYKVDVQNIKESVDLEEEHLAASAALPMNRSHAGLPFDRIHRYAAVDRYLGELATRYPNLVRVVNGGRSRDRRDIRYLRISTTNFTDRRKPVIMIMSMLHAREWITLPVTLYAIHRLVIQVTDQDLVRNIDWIILPIANPDGYEFSHTNSRFWRKNRATGFSPANCIGVDLNRNFDFNWGTASSSSPCSDTFHGRNAFSEPESQVVRDIIREHRARMEMFLDIHSFGSFILFGYGNGQLPPNAVSLTTVAANMVRRINAVRWINKRLYVVGNGVTMPTRISGVCSDFAQSQNVGLSYTFELPAYRNSNGNNGFLVQDTFIRQAGYETWEGIKIGARWVVRNTRKKYMEMENEKTV